jgi:histone H3/H4
MPRVFVKNSKPAKMSAASDIPILEAVAEAPVERKAEAEDTVPDNGEETDTSPAIVEPKKAPKGQGKGSRAERDAEKKGKRKSGDKSGSNSGAKNNEKAKRKAESEQEDSPARKHRWHPGTVALRQIRQLQKSTDFQIPRSVMKRLVKDVIGEQSKDMRLKRAALEAIRSLVENHVITTFQRAQDLAVHSKRMGIKKQDYELALRYRPEVVC